MISCVILSFYTFTHYPFSYLTVIFTRKDFIQLKICPLYGETEMMTIPEGSGGFTIGLATYPHVVLVVSQHTYLYSSPTLNAALYIKACRHCVETSRGTARPPFSRVANSHHSQHVYRLTRYTSISWPLFTIGVVDSRTLSSVGMLLKRCIHYCVSLHYYN